MCHVLLEQKMSKKGMLLQSGASANLGAGPDMEWKGGLAGGPLFVEAQVLCFPLTFR